MEERRPLKRSQREPGLQASVSVLFSTVSLAPSMVPGTGQALSNCWMNEQDYFDPGKISLPDR